jgi:hypothetical protein
VKKVFPTLVNYVKDWKNLLSHAIVGLGLLAVALFLPVAWYYRISIFVAIVVLNALRMRHERMSLPPN